MSTSQTPNLWGDLPDVIPLAAPASILQQQAQLLTDMTRGNLIASVIQENSFEIGYVLIVQAPVLGKYKARLLSIDHGPTLYPVSIYTASSGTSIRCQDEEAFLAELGRVLSSPEIRKLIQGLLSASHASAPPPPHE